MRNRILRKIATAALLLLGGCKMLGPDFVAPNPDAPASYAITQPKGKQSLPVPEPVDPQWWKLLGDPTLTALQERLLTGNLDLRAASFRLAQARAQVGVVAAAAGPQVNANASYTRDQQSRLGVLALSPSNSATNANGLGGRTGTRNSSIFRPYDLFQYGFDVAWEADLWGRVARMIESGAATAEASEEAIHDVQVTASAELARDYVQFRGVQRKLAITRQNLGIAQQSLQLTRQRAAGGVTTDLDVANAAAQVETVAAQIPTLEAQQAELANAVALLLGAQPRALEAELAAPRAVPPVPPRVPVGVPNELARRRPDIRRAEALLHAATADVGVATADFYPRFTLSGSGAIQGVQFRNLADWAAHTYSFGPSVTLPIFESGRLKATLAFREAARQEAALNYQKTLLVAMHDVDNALTAYEAEQRRRDRLQAAVAQNRQALSLARMRYEQGVADFLQVLVAQQALLAAEQALADSTTTVTTNMVQLYKSLGGGWQAEGSR
jgi:NodT family efflux transporter outer membrane factor (OMF) lipoprotein